MEMPLYLEVVCLLTAPVLLLCETETSVRPRFLGNVGHTVGCPDHLSGVSDAKDNGGSRNYTVRTQMRQTDPQRPLAKGTRARGQRQ